MKKLVICLLALLVCAPFVLANDDSTPQGSCVLTTATGSSATNRAPGQLTTIFAQNNGFRGNMFDLQPVVDLSEITAIDVNVDPAGLPTEVDVWYRMDTCVGHDLSPTGWILLGHGTGTAAGVDLPTFIDLAGNGVSFPAGGTYGMYVDITNYPSPGINYTNAASPPTYSNADVSATCYYGKGDPAFTGSTFTYRVWNGTIYYESGPPLPLTVSPKEISAWFGGTATFKLNGGPDLGGRDYILLGTVSGTSPGFMLPGGLLVPINWDWFTYLLYFLALAPSNPFVDGFIGELDVDGFAMATLTLPGHCQLFDDILANFAWITLGPADFASNTVDLMILGAPPVPPSYQYDDGTSENALGWTAGGESVWAHYFDSGIGDTITTVSSAFGSSFGNGPANGDPCWVYVWEDPTNNNDPVDGVLVAQGSGVVANTNTNTVNDYTLDTPGAVSGGFFVACHVFQNVGVYAAPMDETTPYGGQAWFMGGAVFDPSNLSTTARYEMGSIGFPAYWLLRADND